MLEIVLARNGEIWLFLGIFFLVLLYRNLVLNVLFVCPENGSLYNREQRNAIVKSLFLFALAMV